MLMNRRRVLCGLGSAALLANPLVRTLCGATKDQGPEVLSLQQGEAELLKRVYQSKPSVLVWVEVAGFSTEGLLLDPQPEYRERNGFLALECWDHEPSLLVRMDGKTHERRVVHADSAGIWLADDVDRPRSLWHLPYSA